MPQLFGRKQQILDQRDHPVIQNICAPYALLHRGVDCRRELIGVSNRNGGVNLEAALAGCLVVFAVDVIRMMERRGTSLQGIAKLFEHFSGIAGR
ncbi:MAG TPA: hypothetical protein VGC14_19590 [Rhizobium sp.]